MNSSIYSCLWFDGNAQEAATYYCSVFKDSKMLVNTPIVVHWELNGKRFMGLNGGPQFKFTEAVSFVVECADQNEIDYYWNTLTSDGGEESMCGWLKDKFGLSWQIIPGNMEQLMSGDAEKSGRAVQAMLQMRKLIIADLEKAYNG